MNPSNPENIEERLDHMLAIWTNRNAISSDEAETVRLSVLAQGDAAVPLFSREASGERRETFPEVRNHQRSNYLFVPMEPLQNALSETLRVVDYTLAHVIPGRPHVRRAPPILRRPYLRSA